MQGALHRRSRSEDGMESSVVAVVVVVVFSYCLMGEMPSPELTTKH